MSTTLTIRDETTSGLAFGNPSFVVGFPTERITVRELIRTRVYQEVQEYNSHQNEFFRGLVQPTDAEQTLNGYRLRHKRPIDWERQYERAIEAFERNGFIILVNDRQVDDLEQSIEIKPETSVTFLKLVPLVGG